MSAYLRSPRFGAAVLLAAIALSLGGCQTTSKISKPRNLTSRDCLARAMYFESNRSSDDGMIAVGTVVMNRVEAKKYGPDVCSVVGAKNQFAPGVLTRAMTEPRSKERAYRAADAVLRGKRHPGVGKAEFFHTAGYKPGYNNMRYVSIEGGNAFYEKVKKGEDTGHLVRIARNGPSNIDDMIAVQERSLLAHQPLAVPPPVDEPATAGPERIAASSPTAPVYYSRQPELSASSVTPSYEPPAAQLGWQAGPSGLY